jgi:pimeloyl-ACP methyl ester carboxylesterase
MQPHILSFNVPTADTGKTHRLALYNWGGSATKEVVFCVHGLTRNGRDFDIMAEYLANNSFRVLCLDVAGRGKSQWHDDCALYNYPQYVDDTYNIIKQMKLEKIHFVGTSMGGIIGMMLANAFPNLLKTITLNDIGCFIPAKGLQRIAEFVGVNIFKTCAEAEAALRLRCCAYGITDEAHWQNLFTHSIEKVADDQFRIAYDPAIAKNFGNHAEIKDVNLWALWEAVKPIPTLLIHGEKSDILTHETARQMQKSHPNLTLLEIQGVGHAPALADTTQISAIRELLAKSCP